MKALSIVIIFELRSDIRGVFGKIISAIVSISLGLLRARVLVIPMLRELRAEFLSKRRLLSIGALSIPGTDTARLLIIVNRLLVVQHK